MEAQTESDKIATLADELRQLTRNRPEGDERLLLEEVQTYLNEFPSQRCPRQGGFIAYELGQCLRRRPPHVRSTVEKEKV